MPMEERVHPCVVAQRDPKRSADIGDKAMRATRLGDAEYGRGTPIHVKRPAFRYQRRRRRLGGGWKQ